MGVFVAAGGGAAMVTLAPGTELGGGRYVVRAPLGEGGMATVYRVLDTRLDVERAIKVLAPRMAAIGSLRARFEAEARTMARLAHPNVVAVHDVVDEDGLLFIVMEMLAGGSLADRLAGEGPLSPADAVAVLLEVASAVQAAHDAGVVHRDLKPENVLLGLRGEVKVGDFGIAHLDNPTDALRLTRTGVPIGTIGFMAPEQRNGAHDQDGRADVFSLGALLHTLLTCTRPAELFIAELDPAVLVGLPAPFAEVVARATRYRREERYPSAAAFGEALVSAVVACEAGGVDASAPVAPPSGRSVAPVGTLVPAPDLWDALESLAAEVAPTAPVPTLGSTPTTPVPTLGSTPTAPVPTLASTPAPAMKAAPAFDAGLVALESLEGAADPPPPASPYVGEPPFLGRRGPPKKSEAVTPDEVLQLGPRPRPRALGKEAPTKGAPARAAPTKVVRRRRSVWARVTRLLDGEAIRGLTTAGAAALLVSVVAGAWALHASAGGGAVADGALAEVPEIAWVSDGTEAPERTQGLAGGVAVSGPDAWAPGSDPWEPAPVSVIDDGVDPGACADGDAWTGQAAGRAVELRVVSVAGGEVTAEARVRTASGWRTFVLAGTCAGGALALAERTAGGMRLSLEWRDDAASGVLAQGGGTVDVRLARDW